jgi:hypothetical protein
MFEKNKSIDLTQRRKGAKEDALEALNGEQARRPSLRLCAFA